jgi:hypothetical protein
MSKSNERRKSGAGPWSLVVLAFIVATVFYYFDPCAHRRGEIAM